jgi:hypothetical protein
MAKKKKRSEDLKSRGEAALKELEVVAKDVARVKENLRTFLVDCNRFRSGPGFRRPHKLSARAKTPSR